MASEEDLQREAASLLVSRVQWQQLADAMFDSILIANFSGRILLANVRAVSLFGYPSSMMLGRVVEDFMPAEFREKHPGYRTANYFSENRFMGRGVKLFVQPRVGDAIAVDIGLSNLIADEGHFKVVTIRPLAMQQTEVKEDPHCPH